MAMTPPPSTEVGVVLKTAKAFHAARARIAGWVLLALSLLGAGCRGSAPTAPVHTGSVERPVLDPTYRASGRMAAGDVFVHLFEWSWNDIAAECESVLGPNGFHAVQVSPPQEHIVFGARPWWERYQPVSYSIDRSRSGTRDEFITMVTRCRAAGVDIYVDAVINHMTAGGGTGTNGTVYTKYQYPGTYSLSDFHSPCVVNDYQSAANVQDCELVGLADLRTDVATVQQKIADYLIGLARLGVAGFRLDAAKHIQPVELDGILTRVDQALTAQGRALPYYFAEVIDPGTEAVKAADYYGLAHASGGAVDITEFKFLGVGDRFLGTEGHRLAELSQFSASSWRLMPPDKAVVFLENHDTQRGSGIGYANGQTYRLANVWLLAQPYGYPSIMSSYAFDRATQAGRDAGPPSTAANTHCAASLETAAAGQWVCEHRDPVISRMVGFRHAVAGTDLNRGWDNGANAIAFSRGNKGFVAISRETTTVTAAVATGLPAGTYCDVLAGGRAATGCVGASVSVDAAGNVQLALPPSSAIAIHVGSRP